jgi:hypothetical protein
MKKITRETATNLLVDNDINTIVDDHNNGNDHSYINDIMRCGFKGYENLTIEELQVEFNATLVESGKCEAVTITD